MLRKVIAMVIAWYLMIINLYFRKVKKGSLLIDSSTIDPSVSKELAKAVEKMGAVFMDAPVSGGKSSLTVYLFGCLVLLTILDATLCPCWYGLLFFCYMYTILFCLITLKKMWSVFCDIYLCGKSLMLFVKQGKILFAFSCLKAVL